MVFGLQGRASGVWVPNELIATTATQHPERIIGWASVDPNDPEALDQLDHAVNTLKLTGPEAGARLPALRPDRPPPLAVLQRRSRALGIPIIWHQGTTFPSRAKIALGDAAARSRTSRWTSRTSG